MSATTIYSPTLRREEAYLTPASLTGTINHRISKVYSYTAAMLATTALSAFTFAKMGVTVKLISIAIASPFATGVTLLALCISLITATLSIPKENSLLKHGCYGLFAIAQGLVLSPLVLANPSAFVAATASTFALTGGLGLLAMNLKESFQKYERILMAGLGAIALASLSAFVLPETAANLANQISYVGGFALFGAFIIYDTHLARKEAEQPDFDPIKHSMNLYLNAANLLTRFWKALGD